MTPDDTICLFLCGDVMTGRGIDQALPNPGDPTLYESYVTDARRYVELAERANGPIPRAAPFDYIWGDALAELEQRGADLRIVNLETSITLSSDAVRAKPVLYRMHPRNIPCLTAARVDCCCLANNHVLDWGTAGLVETLATLDLAGLRHAGAGRDPAEARAPAILDAREAARVLVFAFGSPTSGIPLSWAAAPGRPGVNLLPDLSEETACRVAAEIQEAKRRGDLAVASIHWGSNWGYDIPESHVRFARRLVCEGADLVCGHSSHHVRGLEVHRGRLIIYGAGDLISDYEGIGGYEEFRGGLSLMYLPRLDAATGELLEVRLVPMQMRRFRLSRASRPDAEWLRGLLNRQGAPFETSVELHADGTMTVRLPAPRRQVTPPTPIAGLAIPR